MDSKLEFQKSVSEKQFGARAMALDSRTVAVKLGELTEHLGCALCHGILRDAHTIPDCLHSCMLLVYSPIAWLLQELHLSTFLVKGSCIALSNKMLSPRPIAS
ncbi:Zinc finger, RING/FYVE/PHD-type [Phytophthora cactorum]|nr:Zinc finger, RING/FYVE/PHD-type [Phytophthora cactorum]